MRTFLVASMLCMFACATAKAQVVLQRRQFDVGTVQAHCVVEVLMLTQKSSETTEKLLLRCDEVKVFARQLGVAGVGNVAIYESSASTRIAISYERGLGIGMMVLKVKANQFGSSADLIFDHFSKHGAELFDYGDMLFAHVGRRFTEGEILPEGTNVYHWQNGKYVFTNGYRWRQDAGWDSRYCIFWKPESCPATVVTEPIPED